MKHLNLFNEHNDINRKFIDFMNNLEQDSNKYLAFLKDSGCRIDISSSEGRGILPKEVSHNRTVSIEITLRRDGRYGDQNWEYIKYDLVPFLSVIEEYSDIVNIYYLDYHNIMKYIDIEDIKDDSFDFRLNKIVIEVDPRIIKNKTLHMLKNRLNRFLNK